MPEIKKTLIPGCYGDGCYGHQHTREACANLLQECLSYEGVTLSYKTCLMAQETIKALRSDMSDDLSEEDTACDLIADLAAVPDICTVGWYEGDFGVWSPAA